jgi:hypothetical protein
VIQRLKVKHYIDFLEFVNSIRDRYEDFYITTDNKRLFFYNNIKLIKKVLKFQVCYGLFNPFLQGIIVIYKEKNFRPYLKILAKNKEIYTHLLKYLNWNFKDELFAKLKQDNSLAEELKKNKFFIQALRGKEVLLRKPKDIREIKYVGKLLSKD